MATIYVSHTATPASPWDSFSNAYNTLKAATDYASEGDDIYVLNTHTEAPGVSINYIIENNVGIYSVDLNSEYLEGATIDNDASTSDMTFTVVGVVTIDGINFYAGDDYLFGTDANVTFTHCLLNSTGTASNITLSTDSVISILNSTVNFPNTTDPVILASNDSMCKIRDSVVTKNTGSLIRFTINDSCYIEIDSVDFSASSVTSIIDNYTSGGQSHKAIFNKCLFPTSVTSVLLNQPTMFSPIEVDLISCKYGSIGGYYYEEISRSTGTSRTDANTYLSYSYDDTNKASTVLESYSHTSIKSFFRCKIAELPAQDLTSATTYTVNFVTTDATSAVHLADTMFWIEAERNDDTYMALGVIQSSRATDNSDDILAGNVTDDGAVEHDTYTGTPTWTGLSTDSNEYEDSLTIAGMTGTEYENATVILYACLAEPNVDVYVDPAVVIT